MKKLTYVIMISKTFPSYHSRKGEPTNFKEKILEGEKIHTIRQNYALWEKRAKKVNAGLAVVSLREWEGMPRRSKQVEIMQLEKIGVQSIENPNSTILIDNVGKPLLRWDKISKNDGLELEDFQEWFKECTKKLNAIIYFTDFRY